MELEVDWTGAGLDAARVRETAQKLAPYLRELSDVHASRDWSHPAASILLPSERRFLHQARALASRWPRPGLTIVVGIGGSNLGTLAVSQALLGSQHNALHPEAQLLFADTVDGPSIAAIERLAERHLATGRHVILNVISKSGTTMETAANFESLSLRLSRLPRAASHLHIVATSDEGSPLALLAAREKWAYLPIPKKVGGRYSVFSNVGLYPLALCGIDIEKLLDGAQAMLLRCLSPSTDANPAALIAAILSLHHAQGGHIHDHFLFSTDLAGVGAWYRQLMGESVGKEYDASGKRRLHMGITPTTSIGSTDLHSMAQLYLGGPHDTTFRFVTVERWSSDPLVPSTERLERLVPHAGGKRVSQLMGAIVGGVQSSFRARSISYIHLRLPDLSESSIGALLMLELVEIMLLARLLEVNAFDQPAVEEYKKETRRLLAMVPAAPTFGEEGNVKNKSAAKSKTSAKKKSSSPTRPKSKSKTKSKPARRKR